MRSNLLGENWQEIASVATRESDALEGAEFSVSKKSKHFLLFVMHLQPESFSFNIASCAFVGWKLYWPSYKKVATSSELYEVLDSNFFFWKRGKFLSSVHLIWVSSFSRKRCSRPVESWKLKDTPCASIIRNVAYYRCLMLTLEGLARTLLCLAAFRKGLILPAGCKNISRWNFVLLSTRVQDLYVRPKMEKER